MMTKLVRPQRVGDFVRSPLATLLGTLFSAYRSVVRERVVQERAPVSEASSELGIRFESLEPRILLSGEVNPALTIEGELTAPGEQTQYEFTVEGKQQIVFDSLSPRDDLNWTLEGPDGQKVTRAFDATDAEGGYPVFELTPGTWRITVDGQNDAAGAYALRLIDTRDAVDLELGGYTDGRFETGTESAVYRFTVVAGDQFFLDGYDYLNTPGSDVRWRLIDPWGRQEGETRNLFDYFQFDLKCNGEYLFVLEGAISNTVPLNYRFSLHRVPENTPLSLELDTIVTAHVGSYGQVARYDFALSEETSVLFDGLTNGYFYWTLTGPEGVKVSNASPTGAATNYANGWGRLRLPAGAYSLSIDPHATNTGDYPFRLLTGASAEAIPLDDEIAGQLDVSRGMKLYKLTLAAGESLYIDGRQNAGGNLSWSLINPLGVELASRALMASGNPVTADIAGEYWLALDGAFNNAAHAVVDYRFVVNRVPDLSRFLEQWDDAPPSVLPEGQELLLGSLVSGALAAQETRSYRFRLDEDSLLVLDNQDPNSSGVHWSLIGPRGSEVAQQYLNANDIPNGYPAFRLPAGDYALNLLRDSVFSPGFYAFRLLDASAFPALEIGPQTTLTRAPGNATVGYRFDAQADTDIFLDWSGGGSVWTLVDPFGRKIAPLNNDYSSRSFHLHLPLAGTYTLLNDGSFYSSSAAPATVTFTLRQMEKTSAPLSLNTLESGTLQNKNDLAEYTFTLDKDSTFFFDALTAGLPNAGQVRWALAGPLGTTNGWSWATLQDKVLMLAPGRYSLLLRNTQDTPAAYGFRVLDRSAALSFVPGVTVDETMPAGETRLYRFNAQAGERFYFDGKYTGSYATWQLIDPFGRVINSGDTHSGTSGIALDAGGGYLLAVSPYSPATGDAHIIFNLRPPSLTRSTLNLNQPVTGTLDLGETIQYSFSLAAPARVRVDFSLENFYGLFPALSWSLSGPRGSEASGNAFGVARTFDLPAGNYELSVSPNDMSEVAFELDVRVVEAPSAWPDAEPLALGQEITTVFPAEKEEIAYRFSLTERTLLMFDAIVGENEFTYQIIDESTGQSPFGRWLWNPVNGQNVYDPTLPFDDLNWERFRALDPGNYRVLLSRPDASGEAPLAFRVASWQQAIDQLLVAGEMRQGTLAPGGRTLGYVFNAQAGENLLFLGQVNYLYGNLSVHLIGPDGQTVADSWISDWQSGTLRNFTHTVQTPGRYLLLFESSVWNSTPIPFQFTLHRPDVPENIHPLVLGEPVEAGLAPLLTECYTFTLSEDCLVLLDPTQVDGSVSWTFERWGEPVRTGVWENADADRLLYLQAGEYVLKLNSQNPAQAAFLLDAGVPAPVPAAIELGVPVSALLSPGD
ncbi:MAG: LEPR-XLL domain-containing protein, partial [Azoarcus sp.]|nr:LEPR-XLL domain-containing protein [Azoarcus sp.]